MSSPSEKSAEAFRTISEVAKELGLATHVLRFWESKFPQIKPLKRAGGRRYYRPDDVILLRRLQSLLHDEGYTIKGVQKLLREEGTRRLIDNAPKEPAAIEPAPVAQNTEQQVGPIAPEKPASPQASLFDSPEPVRVEPALSVAETAPPTSHILPDAPEPEPVYESDYDSYDSPPVVIRKGLSDDQRNTLQDVLNELIALKEKIDQAA